MPNQSELQMTAEFQIFSSLAVEKPKQSATGGICHWADPGSHMATLEPHLKLPVKNAMWITLSVTRKGEFEANTIQEILLGINTVCSQLHAKEFESSSTAFVFFRGLL